MILSEIRKNGTREVFAALRPVDYGGEQWGLLSSFDFGSGKISPKGWHLLALIGPAGLIFGRVGRFAKGGALRIGTGRLPWVASFILA